MKSKSRKHNSKLTAISFIFSLLLVTICFILPKFSDAAHADATHYKLVLDKEDLSGDNYKYTNSTSTLSLNNYKGTTLQFNNYDSTLILKGTNTLYIDINIYNTSLIKALGNLEIKGDGSLNIEISNQNNEGIKALDIEGNLIIKEEVNINIKMVSSTSVTSIKANNITIQDNSKLNINSQTSSTNSIAIESNELNILTKNKISINMNNFGTGISSTSFNSYNSKLEILNSTTSIKVATNTLLKESTLQIISNSKDSIGITSSSKIKILNSNVSINVSNECLKSNELLEMLGDSNINLSSKNNYALNASSIFNLTGGTISIKDYFKNSKYEKIVFYDEENTNTQLILGNLNNNTIYSNNGEIRFEYIGASSSYNTISAITYKDKINEKIVITLENDTFKEKLTNDWITNLPKGLIQKVTRINNYSAYILISGTSSLSTSEKITIRIPKENLTKSTNALTVTSNASYNIYNESFFVRLLINNTNTFVTINETKNLKNNDIYKSNFNDKLSLLLSLEKGYKIKEIYYLNESLEKVSIDVENLSFFMPNQNIILNITLEKTSYVIKTESDIILNKYVADYGDLIIIEDIISKKGYYLSKLYYVTSTNNTKNEISLSFSNFTMPDDDIVIYAEFTKINYSILIPNNVKVYRDSKELSQNDKVYAGDILLITYDTVDHYKVDVAINGKKVLNNELYEVADSDLVITYYKTKTDFLIFYEENSNYNVEIKSNNTQIKNGDYIKENSKLNINIFSSSKYEINEILINGVSYKSTDITIIMPNKDLIILIKGNSQEGYLSDNNKIAIIDGNKKYLSNKKLTVTLVEKGSSNYDAISNQIKKYKLLDIIKLQIEDLSTNQNLLSSALTKTYLKIPKIFDIKSTILYSIKENKIEKESFDIVTIDNEKYALVYTNELNDYALVDTTTTPSAKNNLLSLLKPLTYAFLLVTPILLLICILKKKFKRAN